jgi:RNA polymerase sigma factor (sigma-70 family)
VGCPHTAEDLAQETLLRGFRALATLKAPERLGPWLRGIAQRVCLDWHKSKQNSQVPFSSLADSTAADGLLSDSNTANRAEQNDDLRALMADVEALPAEQRETLLLYYYHDFTYRQLADLLEVSPATVNARLTKARAALRWRLTRAERC